MNFGEEIKVVLDKMVVPQYDLLDRVEYKKYGDVGEKRFYEIIYMIKEGRYDDVNSDMMIKVTHDTQSIVRMVGIQSYEDFCVYFSSGRRDKILSKGV